MIPQTETIKQKTVSEFCVDLQKRMKYSENIGIMRNGAVRL